MVLADSITEVQINCADSCFHEFYSQFSANYGMNTFCTWGGVILHLHEICQSHITSFPTISSCSCVYVITLIAAGPNTDTMKVHFLRHVNSCIRDWGPLWAYHMKKF